MTKNLRFFFCRVAFLWAFLTLLNNGRAWAQVANDDCTTAVTLTASSVCSVPVNGTVAGGSQSLPPTAACGLGLTSAIDVWYSFTATNTTHVVTLAPRFAAILDVRSGTCAASTSIFCTGIANNNTVGVAVGGLTSGQTYFIRIYPNSNTPPSGISSTFALCIGQGATGPANDDCAGALNVPVTTGVCTGAVSADNTLATSSVGAPAPTCGGYQGRDLWFSVTVPASGSVTVQTVVPAGGTGVADTGMSIYSGTCGTLTTVGCDDDGAGGAKSLLNLTGRTPGEVLYVRAWAFNNTQSGEIAVCATALAPTTNDNCAGAIPIPVTTACTTPVSGTLLGASQSLPPTAACGASTVANDLWYSFVASGATQTVNLTSTFGAVIDVRSGTCANSTSVFCGTAFAGQGLTVSGLTSGQTYFLRLYVNGNFTPINQAFTLCINPGPTPPSNDECTGATPMAVANSCVTPVAGTVAGASQSLPVTANCGFATNANDVWFQFVANGTSQTIAFTGLFGAVLEVRSGTCTSSTSVFCGTVFNGQSVVATGLTSGQAYFLRVYANAAIPPLPANSAFTLCLTAGPPASVNDECATAVAVAVVQGCATSTNGTVAGSSQSLPPTASCGTGVTTAADVWYSFVASAPTQLITLTTRFAAVLDVRSGTCASSTSIFCASIFANATTGTVVGGLTTGQTYFIRIYANGATQPLPANATFTLCISPAPTPPANDECAGAIAVPVTATCATPVSGTVEAASQSLLPSTSCGVNNILAQDVWYSFVANGPAQLITLNARFAAVMEVRSGTCANSTSVACAAVFANAATGTSIGGLTSGQTYFLRVYANNLVQPTPANATFTLCILTAPTPPVNDDCAGAINVPVQFGTTCVSQTTADNSAATGSSNVPAPGCAGYQGRDVWFQVTVPASGILTVQTVVPTVGTDIGDTGMSVYSGVCGTLTQLDCDDDDGGNLKSLVSLIGRTPGEVLYIRVWGFNGTVTGTVAVCVTAPTNCAAPTALASASITSTTAQVSWQPGGTPAAGTTYTVEYGPQNFTIGTGTVITALTSPTVQLTSLASGTAYCFYVRQDCPSPNGSSAYTGPSCFTTPCAVPVSLTTTAITSTAAQLGWQSNGTAPTGTTYTVEYGPQGFTPGTGTVISGVTATSFQLSNLQAATAYCFYVRQDCPGSTGNGAFAGPSCFTTAPASTTCPSPTTLAATGPTATSAQLSWVPGGVVTPGVAYTVQYGLQGFALGTGIVVPSISNTNFLLTGLAPSTSYCFYVRQDCGGANGSSAYVGPICFQTTTTAGAPANDDPCGAVTLGIGTTSVPAPTLSSTNVGATTSAQPGIGAPTCSPSTTPRDVWFAMTPAAGVTSATLTLTGAPAGMVRVFTAPNCATGSFTLVTCRSSGTNNTGLTTAVLTALVPGQRYYIAVSGYGAADTPGAFTIAATTVLTATHAQVDTNALLVYPNPSSTGQLTLKLSSPGISAAHATLVNALGQIVRTETLRSGSTEQAISTQGLATGIYTVRVVVGSEVLTRKVVLE
jgi:hypothetical protein